MQMKPVSANLLYTIKKLAAMYLPLMRVLLCQ